VTCLSYRIKGFSGLELSITLANNFSVFASFRLSEIFYQSHLKGFLPSWS
jgi:hypothetical protein